MIQEESRNQCNYENDNKTHYAKVRKIFGYTALTLAHPPLAQHFHNMQHFCVMVGGAVRQMFSRDSRSITAYPYLRRQPPTQYDAGCYLQFCGQAL